MDDRLANLNDGSTRTTRQRYAFIKGINSEKVDNKITLFNFKKIT